MARRVQDLSRLCRAVAQGGRAFSAQADVAVASGAPAVPSGRKALISAPAKTAGQHGIMLTADSGAPVWRIELENTNSKWINQLTGWTSTSDALENVNRSILVFQTKEAAIAFSEKLGLDYEIVEPNPRPQQRPKRFQGYGDNFSVKRKGIPVGGLRSEQGHKKK